MIAALLVLQLSLAADAAVTYAGVPAEVVRVAVHEWNEGNGPLAVSATIERQGDRTVVRTVQASPVVVVFERQDGAYLLDGPFAWPPGDVSRILDRRWRRTLTVSAERPVSGAGPLDWIAAGPGQGDPWPRCFGADERRWACWGSTPGQPGVFVTRTADRVWWSIVSGGAATGLRASVWGRVLIVQEAMGESSQLEVRFAHPALQSKQRPGALRLDTAVVAGARGTVLSPGAVWLCGDDIPSDGWIEIRTARGGPVFLDLLDVASGPGALPFTARLNEPRTVDGVVTGARDQRANGALITLFRLIDPPSSPNAREKPPRRVFVAERTADPDGVFRFEGVGESEYELVAWHAQLGRVVMLMPRAPGIIAVHLESPGMVRGRVMSAGTPRVGVEVTSVPAPESYREAADLIDVKGGDAKTGTDGRFAVMVAARGGGELRVGGSVGAVKRIPLPRTPAALLDLGDIELGAPLELSVVLDQDTLCGVRATGPIGQSGLHIVLGSHTAPGLFRVALPEPGLWAFGLLCGREGIALNPATLRITPQHAGKEVRFSIR